MPIISSVSCLAWLFTCHHDNSQRVGSLWWTGANKSSNTIHSVPYPATKYANRWPANRGGTHSVRGGLAFCGEWAPTSSIQYLTQLPNTLTDGQLTEGGPIRLEGDWLSVGSELQHHPFSTLPTHIQLPNTLYTKWLANREGGIQLEGDWLSAVNELIH